MKVKVKGLVFVGFAAAVFASNAMAGIDLNATQDPKTVTSKKYVDDKIPATATMNYGGSDHTGESTVGAVVLGNGRGEVKFTKLSNNSADVDSTAGANVVVTGKAVADALDSVVNIDGDNVYTDVNEVTIGEGSSAQTIKQVQLTQTPASTAGAITTDTATGNEATTLVTAAAVRSAIQTSVSSASTDTQIPTAKAVFDYAEATANKLAYDATNTTETITAAATATTNNTSNVTFPTTKNVYEFVKAEGGNYQRKLTSSENALYIGKWDSTIGTNGDSTWKALEAVSSNDQASTDYVTIKADNNGVYQVNIPAAQIATTAALTGATATNDTGLVTAGSIRETILQAGSTAGGTIDATTGAVDTTVPTTKNVYEFVTNYAQDTYQPKVGVAGSYDPTANSNAGASKIMIGYTVRSGSEGSYTYSSEWRPLYGQGYVDVVDDVETGPTVRLINEKIATAGADITAATGGTGSSEYNGDLTTARAVNEYVNSMLGNLTIPAMPTECVNAIAANNGHYCALVAGYSATTANHVGLEWTVMAPAN